MAPFATGSEPRPESDAADTGIQIVGSSNGFSQLEGILGLLVEISMEFEIASVQSNIAAIRAALAATNEVNVAVVGGFKAGKSSLLNAIARAELLPVGVLPVTSVITNLRFGPLLQARVSFKDGRCVTVPPAEVRRFVAESENPKNREGVACVTVESPSLEPFAGINFVDTPGMGSAFIHNTETSMRWLPNTGVAILATSADHPMSAADLNLLRELQRHTPKVLVAVTKADLMTKEERDHVLAYVRDCVADECGRDEGNVSVLAFSIREDEESLRQDFQQRELLPLQSQRLETKEAILRHKLAAIIDECLGYVELGLAGARRQDQEKERLRSLVAGEYSRQEQLHRQLMLGNADWNTRVWSYLEARTRDYDTDIALRLAALFETQWREWRRLNLWKFARAFEAWLQEALCSEMTVFNQKEERGILELLDQAQSEIGQRVDDFRNRFSNVIFEALGVWWATAFISPSFFAASINSR